MPAEVSAAIISSFVRPGVEALLGIRPLVPAESSEPPAGQTCPRCGAVRDDCRRIVAGTGIRPGDDLTCVTCDAMSPSRERQAKHHGKAIKKDGRDDDQGPTRLTQKDRKAILRKPGGRAWLAMLDAEASGDGETAARLQTVLYGLRDGLLDLAGLERETDCILGIEPAGAGDVPVAGDSEPVVGDRPVKSFADRHATAKARKRASVGI